MNWKEEYRKFPGFFWSGEVLKSLNRLRAECTNTELSQQDYENIAWEGYIHSYMERPPHWEQIKTEIEWLDAEPHEILTVDEEKDIIEHFFESDRLAKMTDSINRRHHVNRRIEDVYLTLQRLKMIKVLRYDEINEWHVVWPARSDAQTEYFAS